MSGQSDQPFSIGLIRYLKLIVTINFHLLKSQYSLLKTLWFFVSYYNGAIKNVKRTITSKSEIWESFYVITYVARSSFVRLAYYKSFKIIDLHVCVAETKENRKEKEMDATKNGAKKKRTPIIDSKSYITAMAK